MYAQVKLHLYPQLLNEFAYINCLPLCQPHEKCEFVPEFGHK